MKLVHKPTLLTIKLISTVLILGGMGLELWNISTKFIHTQIPDNLHIIFWFERFAISAHLIEGMVAAYLAPQRNKIPWKYAAYTFFVGTVGLLELFEPEKKVP
ncbi:MAG: hypothetical protein QNJ36_18640 [Calothrix sp. MO_167.B42]|nr:hypothetical protein [Calothrix sp. MO_167.B42]